MEKWELTPNLTHTTTFDSRTRLHKWTEFVGSLLCSERFFSGYFGFPSPQKPTFNLI